MRKTLVFATHNSHKTDEVRQLLEDQYKVMNLDDLGCKSEIPETGHSFAENAALKSAFVVNNYHLDCFADDSGLEVEALNNEPGIYSARYAEETIMSITLTNRNEYAHDSFATDKKQIYTGENRDVENLKLVLHKLEGVTNRKACFRTVISLIQEHKEYFFEGVIYGTIRQVPAGDQGFGYDPIFEPAGYDRTFAEMSMEEKNEISHRALAMKKLMAFLQA